MSEGSGLTFVVDTREKKPYTFDRYSIETEEKKLDVGDYSVKGYEDKFSIERKTKSDFVRSITRDRDRFQREIRRADSLKEPLVIVVESPYKHFKEGYYYSSVNSNSVVGTIESWSEAYDLDFWFTKSRIDAEKSTYLQLAEWALQDKAGL